jgi:hypothetical protein
MYHKDEHTTEQILAEKNQLKNIALALKHRISRWRAQLAVRAIRAQARWAGLDTLTDQDINALVQKTRAGRKR